MTAALNYDDPGNFDDTVRRRVQQRLQGQPMADPMAPAPASTSPSFGGTGTPTATAGPVATAPLGYGEFGSPPGPAAPTTPTATAPTTGTQPYVAPTTSPLSSYPQTPGGAPGQVNFTDPSNRPTWAQVQAGLQPKPATGSGDTGYDWLGFAQGLTGGQNVSQGGSNGGFITGGAGYRGNLQPVVDQYNAKYGTKATVAGPDKIDFGDGRGPIDVITGGGNFWYGGPPGSMQGGAPSAGTGAAGSAGAAGAGGAAGTAGAAGAAGTGNPFLDSVRAMLMQRLQGDQQPVDENSPQIAQPFGAASLTAQRGQEAEKRALSERLYAQGDLNSGSLNQGIQQSAERNAVGLAGIKSQLIQKEVQARRDDLNQGLQQAIASGDSEMARQFQMQMALLDAELRREGLGVSLAESTAALNAGTVNAVA